MISAQQTIPIRCPDKKHANAPIKSVQPNQTATNIQLTSMVFDPNSSSPPSDFMNLLKHRMSVYFDSDIQLKK